MPGAGNPAGRLGGQDWTQLGDPTAGGGLRFDLDYGGGRSTHSLGRDSSRKEPRWWVTLHLGAGVGAVGRLQIRRHSSPPSTITTFIPRHCRRPPLRNTGAQPQSPPPSKEREKTREAASTEKRQRNDSSG